jgi:predicted peptidase
MLRSVLLAFFLAAVFSGEWLQAQDQPAAQPGKQVEVRDADTYNYLLFTPAKYEEQEKWPLIVFLHGAGERGDDLNQVKVHGPPKVVTGQPEFGFLVVSPQVPKEQRWEADKVMAIVDQVQKSLKVDPDRVYVTGLSMGGFGTWSVAAKYADRLAAIVPICGGGDPATAEKFAKLPCWVFHGAKDTAVPLKRSDEMVEALKQAGGAPKYTVYPEAGHDSWTESYNNPELYQWLLAQRRQSQAKQTHQ